MGKTCVVCAASWKKGDSSRSFHKLPNNHAQRDQWISLLKINMNKKNIVVCSDHFLRSDFLYESNDIITRPLLKKSALPQRISDALVKNKAANLVTLPSDLPQKASISTSTIQESSLTSKTVYSTNSEANMDRSDHSSSTMTASEINNSTVTVGSRSTITISHPSRSTTTHSLTPLRKR